MDPISALLAGGATLLGGYMSNQQSGANTSAQIAAQSQMLGQTEQYNAQQAAINRQFQAQQIGQQEQFQTGQVANQQTFERDMSNTAYQRAANDMRLAGLNPMMMFGSGSAASTPQIAAPSGGSASGASASVGTPSVPLSNKPGAWSSIGQAVSSAIDASVRSKYIDKMSSEIGATKAEQDLTEAKRQSEVQEQHLREPDVRSAAIKMGYPDWLANTLTYGHDISKGVNEAGDAFWSLFPGGAVLKQLLGGSSAKQRQGAGLPSFEPDGDRSLKPSEIQEVARRVDNLRGSSAKSASSQKLDKIMENTIRNHTGRTGLPWPGQELDKSSGPGYSGSGSDFGFVGDGR